MQSVCGSNLDLRRHVGNGKVHWSLALRQSWNNKVIKLKIHNLYLLPNIKW